MENLKVVVLAAGQGTRMKSEVPKVLHRVFDKTMVDYVIEASYEAGASEVCVVVGHQSAMVKAVIKDKYDNDPHILEKVTVDDIRAFGMIPEFIGRLPIIYTLNGLNEDMLVQILKEPKNAILKQYQKLLALDEVKLDYEEEALHAIAAKALEKHTGARGLRAILEEYMLDIMYEIPKDDSIGQVIITREYIEGTGGPRILLRGQEIPLLSVQ